MIWKYAVIQDSTTKTFYIGEVYYENDAYFAHSDENANLLQAATLGQLGDIFVDMGRALREPVFLPPETEVSRHDEN